MEGCRARERVAAGGPREKGMTRTAKKTDGKTHGPRVAGRFDGTPAGPGSTENII